MQHIAIVHGCCERLTLTCFGTIETDTQSALSHAHLRSYGTAAMGLYLTTMGAEVHVSPHLLFVQEGRRECTTSQRGREFEGDFHYLPVPLRVYILFHILGALYTPALYCCVLHTHAGYMCAECHSRETYQPCMQCIV